MPTNVVATQNRQDPRQVSNTIKRIVNWNDAGFSTGIAFAQYLPQGAFISRVLVEIVTVFNGTAVISAGTVGPAYSNIVPTSLVTTALGVTESTIALGRSLTAAGDVLPVVKLNSGTPTQGQAIVYIEYEGGFAS